MLGGGGSDLGSLHCLNSLSSTVFAPHSVSLSTPRFLLGRHGIFSASPCLISALYTNMSTGRSAFWWQMRIADVCTYLTGEAALSCSLATTSSIALQVLGLCLLSFTPHSLFSHSIPLHPLILTFHRQSSLPPQFSFSSLILLRLLSSLTPSILFIHSILFTPSTFLYLSLPRHRCNLHSGCSIS